MKKKLILISVLVFTLMLAFVPTALAEGNELYIDTENVYEGMAKSYANGYVPSVINGNAEFVLPLKSTDPAVTSIKVTPQIGTDADTPFAYGNYEFTVNTDANGVFLIRLSLPLKQSRVNGTYPVTFKAQYADGQNAAKTQDFPVYLTIFDGTDPNVPEPTKAPTVASRLYIDSNTLYTGMGKTYAQGYMPLVQNGRTLIVLPLLGQTYDNRVTVTANLGATTNGPFIYGNYTQTVQGAYVQGLNSGWGAGSSTIYSYVFALEMPFAKERFNSSYPVTLKAEYLDASGSKAEQSFTVYVTITDGKTPPDPNAVVKVPVERPELFISACTVEPQTVGGNEEFTVTVTVDNIGNLRARSVKLTYGSEAEGIIPANTNNSILFENIAAEEGATISFALKTTKDVLAGNQSFYVALDYSDLYGGAYTTMREFLVNVVQPTEFIYDKFTVPKSVVAGETFSLPANVFNIGKSTLYNVTITATGAGLFPVSSVFLGDIAPGEGGNGELKIFVGMLSMTEGYTQNYGITNGSYTISYCDDTDKPYTIMVDFSTEIKQPVIETDADKIKEKEKPIIQWWVAVLAGFSVIAILVTVIIVSRFVRLVKLR